MKVIHKWKQTVTVLLSAVMFITSVPQTGTKVFAAEVETGIADDKTTGTEDSSDSVVGESSGSESEEKAAENIGSGNGNSAGEDIGGTIEIGENTGDGTVDETEEDTDSGSLEENGETVDDGMDEDVIGEESEEDVLGEDLLFQENALGVETYSTNDYDYKQFSSEETNGGETSLHINQSAIENAEYTFNADFVKEILNNYAGNVYTVVSIDAVDQGTGDKVINAEIYNAAVAYLDQKADDRRIDYNFHSESFDTNWNFWHPSATMSEDISAEVSLTNDDETFSVSISETTKWSSYAESTGINFYVGEGTEDDKRDKRDTFVSILGTEVCELTLYYETTEVDGADVYWNGTSSLSINSLQNLKQNTSYTIGSKTYKGEVSEEDGEHCLSISQFAMEEYGLEFNVQNTRNILAFYEGQTFDVISIDVKTESGTGRIFDQDIYNAVVSYLRTDYENRRIDYDFVWEGHFNTVWTFEHPTAQMTAGLCGDVISSAEKEILSISMTDTSAFAGCSERVNVNLWMENNSDKANEFKGVLGNGFGKSISLYTEGSVYPIEDTGAYWDGEENSCWLSIYNVQNLEAGTAYKVMEYVYRGEVWQDDDGLISLYISSFGLDKDKFGTGELASIIDWYAVQGMTFDTVHIEEKYSSNNVIKKDYINKAITILRENEDPLNRRLTFVFCRCEEEGDIRRQNDMKWHLYDPGTASKDINANVTLTTAQDYGITVKLSKANTYNVYSAGLEYYVNTDFALAGQIEAALGESSSDWRWLAVLKAGTAYEENIHATYWLEPDDSGENIDLNISCVQRCAANTNYVITDLMQVEQSYNIGSETKLSEDENFKLLADASKITWRSFTTNIVAISGGVMTVLNEGEAYISVSYISGGKTCLKVFRFDTSNRMTSIAFDRQSLTMKLEKGEDNTYTDCREYLNVKFYPSDAGCDTNNEDEMTWKSSDSNVVVIEKDEYGSTYIKAIAPGTATITATYVKENKEDAAVPVLTASCEITVLDAITIAENDYPDYGGKLAAVTNFDTKLADVELPEGWEWAAPNTSLTPFKDMDGHAFAAYYTATDAKGNQRTETYMLYVRMVTVTGISISAVEQENDNWMETDLPATLSAGDVLTLGWNPVISNGDYTDIDWETWKSVMAVSWTSSPKNIGIGDGNGRYTFTVSPAMAAGKKTFTVTLTNTKTKKVFAKASYSLTVTKNSLVNFDEDVKFDRIPDENKEKSGTIVIRVNKEKYDALGKKKITVKSEDTSIVTLGKATVLSGPETIEGTEYTVIRIPYTQKNTGHVSITVTAADEVNSARSFELHFADKTPKLAASTVTINSKLSDTAVPVVILCDEEYPVLASAVEEGKFTVTGNNSEKFALSWRKVLFGENEEYQNLCDVQLSIKDGITVKKGTYKVDIQIPVCEYGNKDSVYLEKVTVTVKVVENMPSVTLKQSQKVNTFYTDAEGNGLLTVTVKDNTPIESVMLNDCDYALERIDNTSQYYIVMDQDTSGTDKKGTLTYQLKGYADSITKNFTVSTASTKPTIVLSAKSDTLYPQVGYGTSVLALTDKATGEAIQIVSANYVQNKKKGEIYSIPNAAENKEIMPLAQKVKYNTFNILHEGKNGVLTFEAVGNILAKTDKLALQVQEENWREPIDLSFSIKIDNSAKPKLKLGSSSITLNKNDDVYQYQQVKTSLSLSGCSNILNEDTNVRFVGKDTKSNSVLKVKGSLVLQYWNEEGSVVARFNNNALDKGTYKYDVIVSQGEYSASTVLTVKVIDSAVNKCVSVSAKGSIDVMNRDISSSIAYTPKLSNLTGTVEGGYLTGQDANLFESVYSETDGKLYVWAREGESYSTKNTYKVKAVFWVQPEDYNGFEVESKELSIKVKQGKPKVTVSSLVNTLYRQISNSIEVNISALLGTSDVVIEDVYLLNYTEDLKLEEWTLTDENNEEYSAIYNPETKSVSLTTTGHSKEILKSGKTWSVKMAIHYRDQAGNERDTQVTYKVCVK